MYRKIIYIIVFLPLCLSFPSQKALIAETKDKIDTILQEKDDTIFIDYSEISNIILEKNQELKSLKTLVSSATYSLNSVIAKRYPSIDLQASGFPKYIAGKNYNSNSVTTKTSKFSADPTLNIRWDLIDPLRGSEIKIAKDNLKIANNNYEIKLKDLILEAKSRYHKYQKSFEEVRNKKLTVDLSFTSLKNAKSKFDAGIGTKFDVLEAEAELARDKQALNEKKVAMKINEISLKEILNINSKLVIKNEQNLIGFWNHNLNKNISNGISKNHSLKNINIQKSIKQNQANKFIESNKPNIYISNTLSSSFSKGDSLSTSIDSSKSSSSYTNTLSLNFSWNIFNGGKNKNSYKSKKAEAKSEEYSYQNLQNILKKNINTAYFNLKLNEEKIISSLKEISSTKESLRLSRLRYDVGISTLKDVLIRQNEFSIAKSKNINAIYNYNLNLDELERLTFLKISKTCFKDNIDKNNELNSFCNL